MAHANYRNQGGRDCQHPLWPEPAWPLHRREVCGLESLELGIAGQAAGALPGSLDLAVGFGVSRIFLQPGVTLPALRQRCAVPASEVLGGLFGDAVVMVF